MKDIPYLICRRLIGKINDEEQAILDQWRGESQHNEASYKRMLHTAWVDMEMHRLNITDYRRPLADMKRRINMEAATQRESKTLIRQMAYGLSAAAVVLLIVVGAAMYFMRGGNETQRLSAKVEKSEHAIVHGTTQAVLTLDNGKSVKLGSDETNNKKLIAEAVNDEEIQFSNLTTPRGGEFKVVLEDGTEVWLNSDSRLRYPEKFGDKERRVEVSGEAYFKVAKDIDKPFYVVSGGQEVRVYGTEFNVNAYSDDAKIYTTLVSGQVSLKTISGNNSELMLTPGRQAVYDKSTEAAHVKTVDTEVVTSWRSGAFVFEDQTLEQIMRTLSRWYDFNYEFADKEVAQIVFMGSIPRYGSFNEVVEIFRKMGGIRMRLKGDKVIISTK
ncbi:MAG: FecR family protein [Prevotella sp.]